MEQEKEAYILGTEQAELHRLGVQHQVWASEARNAWQYAEFSQGQTILDLGCGPGFCTRDLAYIVGETGKVIGVDLSANYIEFLKKTAELHQLHNVQPLHTSFDDMDLSHVNLDGVYDRWALAWIPNPAEIIQKIADAMLPGAVFVAHEYYDWSTFQTQPIMPNLKKGIAAALRSFKEQAGDIDVGRFLPSMFEKAGLDVIRTRPMAKLATPDDLTWHWPKSFLNIYLPKLTQYLTPEEVDLALEDLEELEYQSGATIFCPQMIEVIAVKS